MCVLYVSFGSKVRPRTYRCVAMGSAVLFILRFRLLLYSTGSGVNIVPVVLAGFWVISFVLSWQNLYVVMFDVFLGCTRACVCRCGGDVICVGHDLKWWYVGSANFE